MMDRILQLEKQLEAAQASAAELSGQIGAADERVQRAKQRVFDEKTEHRKTRDAKKEVLLAHERGRLTAEEDRARLLLLWQAEGDKLPLAEKARQAAEQEAVTLRKEMARITEPLKKQIEALKEKQ